jgi:O-antigen/teichoic acid export membrane protein
MISFLLNPLYVDQLPKQEFADVSIVFAWLVFFNVILSYGMETAFFRFFNTEENKKKVISTSTVSIFWTSIAFLGLALLYRNALSHWSGVKIEYVTYTIWILVLDALAIIPFSRLRATKRPMVYAAIKIGNVGINVLFNLFFLLLLPQLANSNPDGFFNTIYFENFQVGYIFVANLIASLLTFVILSPDYLKINWKFDFELWKRMIDYAFPILIAGLAFAINEHFDKIILEWMHVDMADIGAYSACYKIGMFMVLFRTAYSLGIEPFFFSHAKNENAPQTYATITKYFVIFGSFICLGVIVFADVIKLFLVPKESYWTAMEIVPLIVLANFFLGIYTNLSVWYKLIDKTKIGAYISIVGAIVTLALNAVLIPMISYMGSAIATILAYGTMMFISYYMGQKKYPIPYDKKSIFTYLGLAIVLSGISFYVPILRETYVFGIASIFFFAYFVYRNEKETILKIIRRK